MLQRHLMSSLKAALADSPVVLLVGARQTGKSTLVQALAAAGFPAHYLTLDDTTVLAAVRHNPPDFLAGFTGRLIIDEVQRAPELLLALKMAVDKDRAPGRFILTGSANVLTLPRVADSLAGRMEVLHLRPFSQGELSGRQESFIEAVFRPDFPLPLTVPALARPDLLARMMTGGYPEVVARPQAARQRAWCKSYLTTLLQRDIRDLANIEGLVELPRLLAILAARAGNLLNLADVSRSSGFAQTTLKRYFALL